MIIFSDLIDSMVRRRLKQTIDGDIYPMGTLWNSVIDNTAQRVPDELNSDNQRQAYWQFGECMLELLAAEALEEHQAGNTRNLDPDTL